MRYNLQALEALPIQDVVIALGGSYQKDREPSGRQYNMHCCNAGFHNDEDKKPSLTVWTEKNICKCHVCGIGGNPIALARVMHKGDFKAACEWLHDTFSVAYAEDDNTARQQAKKFERPLYKTEYISFDKERKFKSIVIEDFLKVYANLKQDQKLKLVYTYLYRYSLNTSREALSNYYTTRGVINNHHLNKLGFLSEIDVENVVVAMKAIFPVEDLIVFGILNNSEHKFPLKWKQVRNAVLVPAFDTYTDLVEGFMLRPVDGSNAWFKGKESRLSIPSILKPMPFGTGYKVLSGDCDIYITEGHVDALSLPEELCFIATPGVQAFEPEQLGVLRGRNIKLVFDQDDAGQKAAWGYFEVSFLNQTMIILQDQKNDLDGMLNILKNQGVEVSLRKIDGFKDQLIKAGVASVEILTWNKDLGKDVNDLLVNGNLNKVF